MCFHKKNHKPLKWVLLFKIYQWIYCFQLVIYSLIFSKDYRLFALISFSDYSLINFFKLFQKIVFYHFYVNNHNKNIYEVIICTASILLHTGLILLSILKTLLILFHIFHILIRNFYLSLNKFLILLTYCLYKHHPILNFILNIEK